MSNPHFAGVGAVVSADIAVPEHEREVRFYSQVLTTGENPLWHGEELLNSLDEPIIGLGARIPEYEHLPLQWMPHIQVADVAASTQRAMDLGGSVLMDGKSEWAVLLDPNGAAFGIVPIVPEEAIPACDSAALPDEAAPVGRICLTSLTVPDASATQDFYRQVVEWPVQQVEMEEAGASYADYDMLLDDGNPMAGIRYARGVNAGLPPVWLIYLPVGDLAESLRRVQEEGGKTIKATQGADGEYLDAVVQDPVGAYLALMTG